MYIYKYSCQRDFIYVCIIASVMLHVHTDATTFSSYFYQNIYIYIYIAAPAQRRARDGAGGGAGGGGAGEARAGDSCAGAYGRAAGECTYHIISFKCA
jgi:hypothetical protein